MIDTLHCDPCGQRSDVDQALEWRDVRTIGEHVTVQLCDLGAQVLNQDPLEDGAQVGRRFEIPAFVQLDRKSVV